MKVIQGGIVMSPSALSVNSNVGTPSSVKSGGWTLEQRSALFPVHIDDELVTSQYQSPITDEVIEKNKSECQEWLDQADLTSPWNSTVPAAKKSHNKSRSRLSSRVLIFVIYIYVGYRIGRKMKSLG